MTTATTKDNVKVVKQLWADGNGRITCDDVRCAGETAVSTGMRRDLNGAEIVKLTPDMATELGFEPRCENCRATMVA